MSVIKQRDIPRGSVEYIEAVIETEDDPTAATVQLALTDAGGTHSWLAAGWTGAATYDTVRSAWVRTARTTSVVTLSTGNYPGNAYTCYAKVALGSEAAIVPAWQLHIT